MKKVGDLDIKGNCYACDHLEYIEAESSDPSGFVCNNREYANYKDENNHLKKLESDEYLSRAKKCCEIELVWMIRKVKHSDMHY